METETGAPVNATSGAGQPRPEGKSVFTLLHEAFDLYRTHAKALLITCAVLFVPASIAKSFALSAIMTPALVAADYVQQTDELGRKAAQASRDALEQGMKNGRVDPRAVDEFSRQNARNFEELSHRQAVATGAVLGGFWLVMLGLLGTMVTAFILHGIVVPLTSGALTISVADRILGGDARWAQVWMLLFRRLGKLLTALIPAALLVALGFVALVVPGIILGFLFTFVAPVVLIEGIGGRAALKRSIELVRRDWLRVLVVLIVFAFVRWLAETVAWVFIPRHALFFGSFFGDLFTMVLMPIPILGSVLLYFDLRRTHEGFTQDGLRADLQALRAPGNA
ncbi:MAG TPA: hypothetical protein VH374_24490 [Polyangia bacterium]|nr:hypothetical protein [Polyangia bacterium]